MGYLAILINYVIRIDILNHFPVRRSGPLQKSQIKGVCVLLLCT